MHTATFRSKSFWTGLATIVAGIGMCATHDVATGLQTIAAGLATIFIRDAIAKAVVADRPDAAE